MKRYRIADLHDLIPLNNNMSVSLKMGSTNAMNSNISGKPMLRTENQRKDIYDMSLAWKQRFKQNWIFWVCSHIMSTNIRWFLVRKHKHLLTFPSLSLREHSDKDVELHDIMNPSFVWNLDAWLLSIPFLFRTSGISQPSRLGYWMSEIDWLRSIASGGMSSSSGVSLVLALRSGGAFVFVFVFLFVFVFVQVG